MHGQFPDDPAPMTLGMAMDKGLVDQVSLDKAVYRILHEMNRFGFLDGKTHQPTGGALTRVWPRSSARPGSMPLSC
jgi:beta-glucosidase